jgi:accessory colonization factor AcfC
MTVTDVLRSAHFVVDQEGKPTAVVLDIGVWEALLTALEDIEDVELARERLKNWRSKQGWTRWEDFEAELDADGVSTVD